MRPWLRLVFLGYLSVVAYGVFGPAPQGFFSTVRTEIKTIEGTTTTARRVPRSTTTRSPGSVSTIPRARAPKPPVNRKPTLSVFGRVTKGSRVEEFFNVLLFAPFGLLFPLCWPRWRAWAVAAGVATSGGIELLQGFLSWRTQSLRDVLWNSLGAFLGVVVLVGLARLASRDRSP
jgi:hypothetical protein